MASPPSREDGCAYSMANKTTTWKQALADRPDTAARADNPARRSCGNYKRTIACNIDPPTCSSCHTQFHRSCFGLTRDGAAAAFARNSWICRRYTTTSSQFRQGPLQTHRFVCKLSQPVSPPYPPMECTWAVYQSPRAQTTAPAGEDRYLPHPGNQSYPQRPDAGLPRLLHHLPRPPLLATRRRANHSGKGRHSISKNCGGQRAAPGEAVHLNAAVAPAMGDDP